MPKKKKDKKTPRLSRFEKKQAERFRPRDEDAPGGADSADRGEEQVLSGDDLERALAKLRGGAPAPLPEDEEPQEERLAAPIGYTRKHEGLPATKKTLGQHWLRDPMIAREIAMALKPSEGLPVLEIGPGPGPLTEALLAQGCEVVAVEIDRRMIEELERTFAGEPRLRLVHADVLRTDLHELMGGRPFAVAGNVPYHISSALMFHLLDHAREHPGEMRRFVIMLQLEVARRILADAGDSVRSVLSVMMRLFGDPELMLHVDRDNFSPPPKVDSAVVRLELGEGMRYPVPHWETLRRLVKGTFRHRRKMLRNSVPGIPRLGPTDEIDFDWTRRPQTLTAEEFAWLAARLVPGSERKGDDFDG